MLSLLHPSISLKVYYLLKSSWLAEVADRKEKKKTNNTTKSHRWNAWYLINKRRIFFFRPYCFISSASFVLFELEIKTPVPTKSEASSPCTTPWRQTCAYRISLCLHTGYSVLISCLNIATSRFYSAMVTRSLSLDSYFYYIFFARIQAEPWLYWFAKWPKNLKKKISLGEPTSYLEEKRQFQRKAGE